jgi:CheY-like chemotaxis protein
VIPPDSKHKNGGRPRVLLTDGQEKVIVAACRILEGAGYDVAAAASEQPAARSGREQRTLRSRLIARLGGLEQGLRNVRAAQGLRELLDGDRPALARLAGPRSWRRT